MSLRKRLKRGEPEGELKSELRREGYTEEDMAKKSWDERYFLKK